MDARELTLTAKCHPSIQQESRPFRAGSCGSGLRNDVWRLPMQSLRICQLDSPRFRRHISASIYRTFATVGNWPKPAIHQISMNARFRCTAVVPIRYPMTAMSQKLPPARSTHTHPEASRTRCRPSKNRYPRTLIGVKARSTELVAFASPSGNRSLTPIRAPGCRFFGSCVR